MLHDAQASQAPSALHHAPDIALVVARCAGRGDRIGGAWKANGNHIQQGGQRRNGQRQRTRALKAAIADAQNSQVQPFRRPDQVRQRLLVSLSGQDSFAAGHYMMIGDNVPLRIQHEAAAVAVFQQDKHDGWGNPFAHGGIVEGGCGKRRLPEPRGQSEQRQQAKRFHKGPRRLLAQFAALAGFHAQAIASSCLSARRGAARLILAGFHAQATARSKMLAPVGTVLVILPVSLPKQTRRAPWQLYA